jgi:hypothetical protein
MPLLRRPSSALPPALHWDGTQLLGTAASRVVTVTVPLRLVAMRREILPPAPLPALKAAVRLKAERAFAVLGPVAIDAVLYPVRAGHCTALLLALPQPVLTALTAAAQAQQLSVGAVRIAEFAQAIPSGGVVSAGGEQTLIALTDGEIHAVAALGSGAAAEAAVTRERRRLGVADDAPGAPAIGWDCDFLNPSLTAVPTLLSRPGARPALLAAGLAGVLLLAGGLAIADALSAQAEAKADEARIKPVNAVLLAERADLKAVDGWFANRPTIAAGLVVLAAALPPTSGDEQVRLVRVRQIPGEAALAEGIAGDRAQMLGFLARLRSDPRIAGADIRTFRTPTKGSSEVTFELSFRLKADGATAPTGGAHAGA